MWCFHFESYHDNAINYNYSEIKMNLNFQDLQFLRGPDPGKASPDLSEFARYSFIITVSALIIALVIKIIHFCKSHKKDALNFRIVQSRFMSAVNNSLAVYISESPCVRVLFFLFSCYLITIGYPVYFIFIQSQDSDSRRAHPFLNATMLIFSGSSLIQLLLISMIGAKTQMIVHQRHPLDTAILTSAEKSQFLRANLARAFITLLIIVYLALAPHLSIGKFESLGDFLRLGITSYYVLDRLSFLRYEKNAIKLRAVGSKIMHKVGFMKKFIHDYSPKTLVQAVACDEMTQVETHQDMLNEMQVLIESRVRILEHTLETIEEDNSQPMLEVTGEIHIIPKLFLLLTIVTTAIFTIDKCLVSLGSNYGSTWLLLVGLFLYIYVTPILLLPIFCSQMIFGFKESEKGVNELETGNFYADKNDNNLEENLL